MKKLSNNQCATYHAIKANPGIKTIPLAELLGCNIGSVVKYCEKLAKLDLIIIDVVSNRKHHYVRDASADVPEADIKIDNPRRVFEAMPRFEIIPTTRGFIHRRIGE